VSRYVVTGGAGRLGRSVVASLAEAGHDVVSIDRVIAPNLPARQLDLDLLDHAATIEAIRDIRPDGIVHLAAIAVPFGSPDNELYATNTSLAFNVLDAALASGTTCLLMASSPTVIGYGAPGGWTPDYLPIDEQHPLAPWNGYALSKQAVEAIVAMAAIAHGDRLRVGAFRPCYVIAPEEWEGALTQQGHSVEERLDRPELSAVALFNYLDARDAGDFVLSWLERGEVAPNGTCFFVGAADSLARAPIAELLPQFVSTTAPLVAAVDDLPAVFSSALAERLLGWRPRRSWRTELVAHGARLQEQP